MLVFLGTLIIFCVVIGVLMWVKTPHYLMSKRDVIQLFHQVLVGQASENDWAIFLSSSFRHSPDLEAVRQECVELDENEYLSSISNGYLLTQAGLVRLRQLLFRVESLDD